MRELDFTGSRQEFCQKHASEIRHHVDAGRIYFHMEKWRNIVPRDNVLLINYDDICHDPEKIANLVFCHIGATPTSMLPFQQRIKIVNRIHFVEEKKTHTDPPADLINQIHYLLHQPPHTSPHPPINPDGTECVN